MRTIIIRALLMSALLTRVALADAVTDWNLIMRNTVSAENPFVQARVGTITHLAIFEAVNAITRDYEPYLGTIAASADASPQAAAIAAAHKVLSNYVPARASSLDAERVSSLARISDGPAKTAGIAAGEAAAAAMIARRANDGWDTPIQYTPLTGVGYWQPTPPNFPAGAFLHIGKATPFAMVRNDQFRPAPPPAITSNRYRRDYNEVKNVGDALSNINVRPQDRINVVRIAAMTTPIQMWNSVADQLSVADGFSLSQNARLFALVNMTMADAAIAVFEAKYFYNFWRPLTAIRAGDIDGNPGTDADPNFNTFIVTPPYPDYPSGFGGLSNPARALLERIFGRGRHPVTLSNPALQGVTLQYTKLRHLTDDIADARIYAGIHFRFAQEAAEKLGEGLAQYMLSTKLRCARQDECLDSGDIE
jgi:hypothetical protein